jgi:arylformamidase
MKEYKFAEAVDLSQPLEQGMPIYPGNPVPDIESFATLDKDGVNLTRLTIGSHTGTHVDAPVHFIEGGLSVDRLPLGGFFVECVVVDVSQRERGTGVTASDLDKGPQARPGDVLAVFTGCSRDWGDKSLNSDYTYLAPDAADYLVEKRVKGVGIDFLSVEKYGAKVPVIHRKLLGKGIFIVESLNRNLEEFKDRRFLLVCLPIRLAGRDAAPCRAVGVPIEES